MQLHNKNILVGICGGIAAYKTCTLVRLLVKEGANVKVIMTQAACEFINKNTLKALTGHDVAIDIFDEATNIDHINITKDIYLFVIAPATANSIAKLACGLADNMLSATALACTKKIMLAPSMNCYMYENAATQENINKLASRGYYIIRPGKGDMACGDKGNGRMAEPEDIFKIILAYLTNNVLTYQENNLYLEQKYNNQLDFKEQLLLPNSKLTNKKILITAGPTREYIDPVRYISNESSGKMGYALAEIASKLGAEVTLISGPVTLKAPANVKVRNVISADEMFDACLREVTSEKYDIIIATAAVSDFKACHIHDQKIKKNPLADIYALELTNNKDIIASIANIDEEYRPYCVGFAAETQNFEENALYKLATKNLDLIVLNDVSRSDIGFNSDDNEVFVYSKEGFLEHLHKMPKNILAAKLLELIVEHYTNTKDDD